MEVKTCAVLYNASFDLLNVNLQNNYKFEERYLGDNQLIDFFDETLFGFRRKYQEACLDEDLNVITVESHFNITNEESIDSNSDESVIETELFLQLDRQI